MRKKTTEIAPGTWSRATNYPPSNVRGDIFQVVRMLAEKSSCETLQKVVSGKMYYRGMNPTIVDGVEGKEEVLPIVKVDRDKRDRMMRMVADNLKDGSSFRINLDEYLQLKWLVETYWKLAPLQTMSERLWVQIQDRVNEIVPSYYLTEKNDL